MIKKDEVSKLLMKAFLQRINEKNGSGCKKCFGGTISEMPETKTDLQQVKMVKEPLLSGSGTGKKKNVWMEHVAKVKSENPGMKYSDVLKKAKESYTKIGGSVVIPKTTTAKKTKTSADYVTEIKNPVKTQETIWDNFNQSKKIKKPKTSVVAQKSSSGRKPKITIIVPEKNTKPLKMTKPKKEPLGVQSTVQLRSRNKRESSSDKDIIKELKRINKSDVDEQIAEYQQFGPKREGALTKDVSESKPMFGSGMKGFEKELFKYIEKETKELSQSKKITFAKKYITEKLKEKGWKPFEIKAVLTLAIDKLNGTVGSGGNAKPENVKEVGKTVQAVIPPSDIEILMVVLEKGGVFDATKKTLNSVTDKLIDVVNDPTKYRQQRILSKTIPNLQFNYDKLKNIWDIKHTTWTQFRQNNHKIRMMNIKSNITRQINQLIGINMLSPKPV